MTSPTIIDRLVRTVQVPMDSPHCTASGVIESSPLVLVDVVCGGALGGVLRETLITGFLGGSLAVTSLLRPPGDDSGRF